MNLIDFSIQASTAAVNRLAQEIGWTPRSFPYIFSSLVSRRQPTAPATLSPNSASHDHHRNLSSLCNQSHWSIPPPPQSDQSPNSQLPHPDSSTTLVVRHSQKPMPHIRSELSLLSSRSLTTTQPYFMTTTRSTGHQRLGSLVGVVQA